MDDDGRDRGDDPAIKALNEQLTREDPRLAAKLASRNTAWVARRLAGAIAIAFGGFAVLAFGRGAMGLTAVVFGIVLVAIGGYDMAMRTMQLRRISKADTDR